MKTTLIIIAILTCITPLAAFPQEKQNAVDRVLNLPDRFFNVINRKVSSIDKKIDKQTEVYIRKLFKEESALKEQFYKLDSIAAKSLFLSDPEKKYASYLSDLRSDSVKSRKLSGEYLPFADSLHGSLSFLNQNTQLIGSAINNSQIEAAVLHIQQLQGKMNADEEIRQYVMGRKEQIKQFLSIQKNIPKGIRDIYDDYNKQFYYYSRQLKEYKDILNDPDKMLKAVLKILNKLPAFAAFMKSNSFLSGILTVPDDYNMGNSLPGMQTRSMINGIIQNQISSGGPNAASAFSQNLQSAQQQLALLKNKLSSLGGGSENADLPSNFKPNNEKTKSFFRRLEYGANFQTTRRNYFFPVISDIGFSVGYRLNDKSILGIGVSYKIGWGSDINHIRISNQGLGLRSFLDVKLKGSFYASGGLEYNYLQPFSDWTIVKNINRWQQSGLIGLTKMVTVNTKFFKKTKIQLLWDFLSYQQIPRTQAFKFRIGFNF